MKERPENVQGVLSVLDLTSKLLFSIVGIAASNGVLGRK